jgi:hypothetical protein
MSVESENEAAIETWPVLAFPTDLEITEKLVVLADPVKKVEELAKQFEKVEDDATFDAACNFALDCRTVENRIEKRRTAIVAKPNTFLKLVNGTLNPFIARVEKVRKQVSATAQAYKKAKDDAAAKKAQEERQRLEKEALERAQRLQDAGNTEAANQLLDIAASAPKPAVARSGVSGGTAFDRGRWVGVVKDKASILRAAIEGRFPLDAISISQSYLNEKARETQMETVIDGIQITKEETLGLRRS